MSCRWKLIMQLVCALMKSFCRLIEFKGARKKAVCEGNKICQKHALNIERFGEL